MRYRGLLGITSFIASYACRPRVDTAWTRHLIGCLYLRVASYRFRPRKLENVPFEWRCTHHLNLAGIFHGGRDAGDGHHQGIFEGFHVVVVFSLDAAQHFAL